LLSKLQSQHKNRRNTISNFGFHDYSLIVLTANWIDFIKVDDRRNSVILSRTTHFISRRRSRGELYAEKLGPDHPWHLEMEMLVWVCGEANFISFFYYYLIFLYSIFMLSHILILQRFYLTVSVICKFLSRVMQIFRERRHDALFVSNPTIILVIRYNISYLLLHCFLFLRNAPSLEISILRLSIEFKKTDKTLRNRTINLLFLSYIHRAFFPHSRICTFF